ncbi:MAG: hypothetical protein U5N58_10025 [Actinomycetota bacterium]|nr:hypothetical protein [Actinomycetota bacterium]
MMDKVQKKALTTLGYMPLPEKFENKVVADNKNTAKIYNRLR